MRKERFNRFVYLAAVVLHHRVQVQEFLQVHDTITNTLACIVRAFEDMEFLNVFLVMVAVIGVQLIEPFLALTYYQPVTYEDLIPMSRELYDDLLTTNPSDLLKLDQFAFTFAQKRLDMKDVIRWDPVLLTSLKEAIAHYHSKVSTLLKMLLPELANGWFIQRGNIFGFGDYDENSPNLVTAMDIDQLNKAPINNMDSERCVGAVNFELGVRGRNELDAASSCLLKGKSYDLVELMPAGEFWNFVNLVKPYNNLVKEWKVEQSKLQDAGLTKKQIAALAVEKRRMKDLEKLKSYGGPMTTPEEVDKLVDDDALTDDEKLARIYIEVRYARDTTLSLPRGSDLFDLKKNYKNLSLDTYRKNLKVYLSKVTSASITTWEDYDNAVSKLASARL